MFRSQGATSRNESFSRGPARAVTFGMVCWSRTPAQLCRSDRLLAVALRQREDFDTGRGHADRMLELRRQRAIARHRGPAVGQDFYMRLAEIDHRLDGEEHAGLQHHALAGPPDMD